MGLFSKKDCAVCGGDMGIVTDNKLADGGLCKECAAKLSPWFRGMRQATVEQIEEQLAYREDNRAEVERFNPTLSYGSGRTKLLIDEVNQKFVVTAATDLVTANPDVLDLSQVMGCEMEIDEDSYEISDINTSQNPDMPKPHRYTYDFYINISVNHPYFNQMRFQVNGDSVEMEDMANTTRMR